MIYRGAYRRKRRDETIRYGRWAEWDRRRTFSRLWISGTVLR